MRKLSLSILLIAFLFIATSIVQATIMEVKTFGFTNITANNAGNAAIGEAQLFVDVKNDSSGQVLFTFRNIGPLASSITDVYFDDGSLLGIASIINGAGVSFSQLATPPDLPGGNPGFQTTAGFSADSDPPAQPNGVNPGEEVIIVFDLQSGQTYNDVLSDLDNGDLAIGIHVQGFENGGSESFVNSDDPVPEPGTLLLMGSGLVGIAGYARLRFGRKKK